MFLMFLFGICFRLAACDIIFVSVWLYDPLFSNSNTYLGLLALLISGIKKSTAINVIHASHSFEELAVKT
jgi:hypothetical protein